MLPYESGFYSSPFGGTPFSSALSSSKFTGSKFKPVDATKFLPKSLPFSVVGTDLLTGKRDVDILKNTIMPEAQVTTTTDYEGGDKPSTGNVYSEIEKAIDFEKRFQPLYLERMQQAAGLQSELSRRQIRDLYPYLSAAASEATARNLAASQAYRAFAEQLPSNVQNIMASKQQQIQSAQVGEAALQQATADQLRAAKESQGRFAGQYIQFG